MTKLLVANRSEIACRVFQACRELGIESWALRAPGDEQGRHLTYCDQVIDVDSYLNIDQIVEKAKACGIDWVHPGYGFLSERAEFVTALEKAGIGFIGPQAKTMDQMGNKIAAKAVAEKNQVPTLPWAKADVNEAQGLKSLEAAASEMGYPLLVKAAAGGGGKGMRLVHDAGSFADAATSASREALNSFGDGALFIEKFIGKPKHIEVQVFGFGDGTGVHVAERDCTLQRRHQKIIEEAPAVFIDEKTRVGLWESALKLVAATQYRGAGTVEFLVDPDGEPGKNFYFLEMNTRLQVEHPVSEWVTGVDLVRHQILFALDPKHRFTVGAAQGVALEARIYAEDPYQEFLPTPGKIEVLKWPTGAGIRVDSGIEEGQEITTQFDPMLAKLIVWGQDRQHALARLRLALEETVVLGPGTNIQFLKQMTELETFASGQVYTQFIENELNLERPGLGDRDFALMSELMNVASGFSRSNADVESLERSPWNEVKLQDSAEARA